jgi:hypothetical protein
MHNERITEGVVILDPKLIWKAMEQTHQIGSECATVPFPSYEAMCFYPCMKYFVELEHPLCFKYDDKWDDENILVCLRPLAHSGECGKPGARQAPRVRVE